MPIDPTSGQAARGSLWQGTPRDAVGMTVSGSPPEASSVNLTDDEVVFPSILNNTDQFRWTLHQLYCSWTTIAEGNQLKEITDAATRPLGRELHHVLHSYHQPPDAVKELYHPFEIIECIFSRCDGRSYIQNAAWLTGPGGSGAMLYSTTNTE